MVGLFLMTCKLSAKFGNNKKLRMYQTNIPMIMDLINTVREHVFFKDCSKVFKITVPVFHGILMILRIISSNEPKHKNNFRGFPRDLSFRPDYLGIFRTS